MGIYNIAFWKRLLENAVHAFGGSTLGVILASKTGLLASVPWDVAVSAGGYGALVSVLLTLSSQEIPNTPPGGFLPPKGN